MRDIADEELEAAVEAWMSAPTPTRRSPAPLPSDLLELVRAARRAAVSLAATQAGPHRLSLAEMNAAAGRPPLPTPPTDRGAPISAQFRAMVNQISKPMPRPEAEADEPERRLTRPQRERLAKRQRDLLEQAERLKGEAAGSPESRS